MILFEIYQFLLKNMHVFLFVETFLIFCINFVIIFLDPTVSWCKYTICNCISALFIGSSEDDCASCT